jgi:nitroimidazol reductase NimA-like FMN-containing flavoprotein (pyridoxamine 5'-phosphate oxidase superfamily)
MDRVNEVLVSTLDEEACWNLLARVQLGRLAVCVDGRPDIFPVNHVVDGPHVLFRTAPGSKLDGLSGNPEVAFEVDDYDETHASSVVLRGTATRLERLVDIDAADALPLKSWIPTLKYRWVRISPTSITGRRFPRGPEPVRYVATTRRPSL